METKEKQIITTHPSPSKTPNTYSFQPHECTSLPWVHLAMATGWLEKITSRLEGGERNFKTPVWYLHLDQTPPSHPAALLPTPTGLTVTTQDKSWCKLPSPVSASLLCSSTLCSSTTRSSNVVPQIKNKIKLKSHPYLDFKSTSCHLLTTSLQLHCFPQPQHLLSDCSQLPCSFHTHTQKTPKVVFQRVPLATNSTGFIMGALQAWGCHRDGIQTPSVCQALQGKC